VTAGQGLFWVDAYNGAGSITVASADTSTGVVGQLASSDFSIYGPVSEHHMAPAAATVSQHLNTTNSPLTAYCSSSCQTNVNTLLAGACQMPICTCCRMWQRLAAMCSQHNSPQLTASRKVQGKFPYHTGKPSVPLCCMMPAKCQPAPAAACGSTWQQRPHQTTNLPLTQFESCWLVPAGCQPVAAAARGSA
jgi:hypothetical protein